MRKFIGCIAYVIQLSFSAILPLFWRHDIANISTFAAKTWEKLLWRHEIHGVFPRNWANALQNL